MELTSDQKLNFGISILTAAEAFKYEGDMKKGAAALLAETDIQHMPRSIQKEFEGMSLRLQKMFLSYCAAQKAKLNKKAVFVAEIALSKLQAYADKTAFNKPKE